AGQHDGGYITLSELAVWKWPAWHMHTDDVEFLTIIQADTARDKVSRKCPESRVHPFFMRHQVDDALDPPLDQDAGLEVSGPSIVTSCVFQNDLISREPLRNIIDFR